MTQIQKWVLRVVIAFVCTPLVSSSAFAQIQFIHDSQQVKLGPVGTETQITLKLYGTSHTDFPLDVEIVRDGHLSHITVPYAQFNTHAEPTYSFTLASPRAGFIYRFRLRDQDGRVWESDYYWALQQCQESGKEKTINLPAEHPDLKATKLALISGELEKELLQSSLAEKRLRQLAEMLQKGGR